MTYPHNSVRIAVEYINRVYRITDEMASLIRYLEGDQTAIASLSGSFIQWLFIEADGCVRVAFEDISAYYRFQIELEQTERRKRQRLAEEIRAGFNSSFLIVNERSDYIFSVLDMKGLIKEELTGYSFLGSKRFLCALCRFMIRYDCVRRLDGKGNQYNNAGYIKEFNTLFNSTIGNEFDRKYPKLEKKLIVLFPFIDNPPATEKQIV